jgi:hypothetical protein
VVIPFYASGRGVKAAADDPRLIKSIGRFNTFASDDPLFVDQSQGMARLFRTRYFRMVILFV